LPHTTGLDCPIPGIGVFQRTPTDFSPSQLTGAFCALTATPEACAPRNCGQFCALAVVRLAVVIKQKQRMKDAMRLMYVSPVNFALMSNSIEMLTALDGDLISYLKSPVGA
jgi:hypothetical protein